MENKDSLDQLFKSLGDDQATLSTQTNLLMKEIKENLENLEAYYNEIREEKIVPNLEEWTSLPQIRDVISDEMHRQETLRNATLSQKQELKEAKLTVAEQIKNIKQEMESIQEENHRIEAQLKAEDPNLPLVLKLMRSQSELKHK